ncbi:MAG: bifunctional adenosylcobinamide kinase/adenosylcobinamide-phosphate guanylyltransferase [Phocaeicola vulgatus]
MKRIILITGGARSGKSTYAEKLALELSPLPFILPRHASGTKNSARG